MRLSPLTKLGGLAALALASGTCGLLMASGGHSAQPPSQSYTINQDAQTGAAVITSSAPASTAQPAAPKLAAPTSTVVVKQPAVQQQGAVVTDPTMTDIGTASAPSSTDPAPTFQPIQSHPGNGAPSSAAGNSIPSPTEDASPSN